jgi:pimeloyl-ACP methyl ester carboxylesterase
MDNLNKQHIETNGIRLHVVQAGPEDGPLVILLHGFPEFWYGWRHQVEALAAAGYRCWAPDQRGYNLSDKPKGVNAYHLDTLAGDILGLMDAAGQDKAVVIGHDWGAVVAWHLATHHAERVEKLGILNVPHPSIIAQTLRRSRSQLRKSWYMFFFQIPWLPEWLLGRNDAQGARELLRRSGMPGSFTEEDLEHYRAAWTQSGALKSMINWYRSAIRTWFGYSFRSDPKLPHITVPTLMLWGVQDTALGYEMAQPSIDLCEDGELVPFEDATHWVQHDEAEAVTQRLLAFIA